MKTLNKKDYMIYIILALIGIFFEYLLLPFNNILNTYIYYALTIIATGLICYFLFKKSNNIENNNEYNRKYIYSAIILFIATIAIKIFMSHSIYLLDFIKTVKIFDLVIKILNILLIYLGIVFIHSFTEKVNIPDYIPCGGLLIGILNFIINFLINPNFNLISNLVYSGIILVSGIIYLLLNKKNIYSCITFLLLYLI